MKSKYSAPAKPAAGKPINDTQTITVDDSTSNAHNSSKTLSVYVIGLPNTGKSHVYNLLTGDYALVSNCPMTTITIQKKTCTIKGKRFEIFDTPAIHSLYIHSQEELVVRDLLLNDPPDILLQCIDSSQFRQSLTLTADLVELGLPFMVVLNAIDETKRGGTTIDAVRLSNDLGVPVVTIDNLHDKAEQRLYDALLRAKPSTQTIRYRPSIEAAIERAYGSVPSSTRSKRKVAILHVENNVNMKPGIAVIPATTTPTAALSDRTKAVTVNPRLLLRQRNGWVDRIYRATVKKQRFEETRILPAITQLSRHPFWGVIMLLVILGITYFFVVDGAAAIASFLDSAFVVPVVAHIGGAIRQPWLRDLLIGDYGLLTLGLFNAFCTVLPVLSLFFLIFGTLEDSGYIPSLCVLTNKLSAKIGITGKSVMPLLLGFGCKTMATMTTRSLQSRKEKLITIFLIAFAIPCSAQLGLNMAILGKSGFLSFIIAIATLVFFEICAGFLLNRFIKNDNPSDFIQELPQIRIPDAKAIVVKTYFRLFWFLKEAVPIFVLAAALLYVFDLTGGLLALKTLLSPIITGWLGLPVDIVDVLILTMARHEAAAGMLLSMVNAGALTYIQIIVAVCLTTMFVPCFANIAAMCKELGAVTGIGMSIMINGIAFIVSGILRIVLEMIF